MTQTYQIHMIAFADDAIAIEYTDNSDRNPFEQSMQVRIPYSVAQLHQQVAQDMQELVADAYTLLDAVLAARVGASRVQEMGRS